MINDANEKTSNEIDKNKDMAPRYAQIRFPMMLH